MSHRRNLAKGLLAGVAAGIAATLVMDQFQSATAAFQQADEKRKKLARGESDEQIAAGGREKQEQQKDSESSTEVVARKIAEVAGYTLPREYRKSAGQAVHYGFGTLMGAAYGAAAEVVPQITAGEGTAFGTALFFGADEGAVTALHLSGPPSKTPLSAHLQYWAAHLVYGAALELVRKAGRRLLGP